MVDLKCSFFSTLQKCLDNKSRKSRKELCTYMEIFMKLNEIIICVINYEL